MRTNTRALLALLTLPLLALLLLPLASVRALGVAGLSVTAMDCTGFTVSDYTATFDRDNTGSGSETFEVTVRDSANTLLWISTQTIPLGTFGVNGDTYTYDLAAPVNGDLNFAYRSLAGNGFDEQVAFTYTGLCFIPTATPTETPTSTATYTPTPTPTDTPVASVTPTPTASATANYIVRSTVEVEGGSQDVAIVYQITAGDIGTVTLLGVLIGLQVVTMFMAIRREK